MKNAKHSFGFTLIEVLVAITIMVTVVSVVFPMFNQAQLQHAKADAAREKVMIEENMRNQISLINPGKQKEGAGDLGDLLQFEWKAEPVSAAMLIRGELTADSDQFLQLYKIAVAYRSDSNSGAFEFEQLGWYDK
ncbi:prepilin-type N-terminal cleavage/methylation domain-containing protein [Oceanimonas sp. CHS3-5]|uniref:type II secretion system protein n=1 Tax=Oceanimonas sp. CHS3-5 TaxID=3068186 RepID=UPI00274027B1|nr:prepilin-type N-terminal cleavage/methylation domain-containing protein [Oceanimonas sp. CHS3-5]MDP5293848.1 prepilin-type N-terminal cleavage/methylation domain-containing protein [Oceanimonas sp. CHS3-5]